MQQYTGVPAAQSCVSETVDQFLWAIVVMPTRYCLQPPSTKSMYQKSISSQDADTTNGCETSEQPDTLVLVSTLQVTRRQVLRVSFKGVG